MKATTIYPEPLIQITMTKQEAMEIAGFLEAAVSWEALPAAEDFYNAVDDQVDEYIDSSGWKYEDGSFVREEEDEE